MVVSYLGCVGSFLQTVHITYMVVTCLGCVGSTQRTVHIIYMVVTAQTVWWPALCWIFWFLFAPFFDGKPAYFRVKRFKNGLVFLL